MLLFLLWILKMHLLLFFRKMQRCGIFKKLAFIFKHLKIKSVPHFTGWSSVAMIRIELPSVSSAAFTVALFHSFINWAFWFPWEPNRRHWLLRSSLCCTKHRSCECAAEWLHPWQWQAVGILALLQGRSPSWFLAWRILMDFPDLYSLTVTLRYGRLWKLTVV